MRWGFLLTFWVNGGQKTFQRLNSFFWLFSRTCSSPIRSRGNKLFSLWTVLFTYSFGPTAFGWGLVTREHQRACHGFVKTNPPKNIAELKIASDSTSMFIQAIPSWSHLGMVKKQQHSMGYDFFLGGSYQSLLPSTHHLPIIYPFTTHNDAYPHRDGPKAVIHRWVLGWSSRDEPLAQRRRGGWFRTRSAWPWDVEESIQSMFGSHLPLVICL